MAEKVAGDRHWNKVRENMKTDFSSKIACVLWRAETEIQQKIVSILKMIPATSSEYLLVQFWGVEKSGGSSLTTRDQPFLVGVRGKSLCSYRERCLDDEGGGGAAAGAVGRVYRSRLPESTPHFMLYSDHEFPLRDQGIKGYLALPVLGFNNDECYGVLEVLSLHTMQWWDLNNFASLPKRVELRSTHADDDDVELELQEVESEISDMVELAVKAIPELHLAQVWVPCRKMSNNMCCMRRACYKTPPRSWREPSYIDLDVDMDNYLAACSFHHQQIDLNCFSQNSWDLTMSTNPLAHYAQKARLSHRLLLRVDSRRRIYVVEYFLDACGDTHLRHLIKVTEMEMESQGLKFTLDEGESANPFGYEQLMRKGRRPHRHECGWVVSREGEGEEAGASKIQEAMSRIVDEGLFDSGSTCRLVQFWAPKMGGLILETAEQWCGVSDGLAPFRKECMRRRRPDDDEVGPPARVFRKGMMEITPDLRLYSTREFPLRNLALQCCHGEKGYIALPVFDHDIVEGDKCVGVVEFVGCSLHRLHHIQRVLKRAQLHTNYSTPSFIRDEIRSSDEAALSELKKAVYLSTHFPQLCVAEVWASHGMELALAFSTNLIFRMIPDVFHEVIDMSDVGNLFHIQTRDGIARMVLESENKSCFCPNLSDLSIEEEPLSHLHIQQRRRFCYALCLQSLDTGNDYVLKFFLMSPSPDQKPAHCLRTFLKFLLPLLRLNLKRFHIAAASDDDDVLEFKTTTTVQSSNNCNSSNSTAHAVVSNDLKRRLRDFGGRGTTTKRVCTRHCIHRHTPEEDEDEKVKYEEEVEEEEEEEEEDSSSRAGTL